jgi:hypothetical protein
MHVLRALYLRLKPWRNPGETHTNAYRRNLGIYLVQLHEGERISKFRIDLERLFHEGPNSRLMRNLRYSRARMYLNAGVRKPSNLVDRRPLSVRYSTAHE